MPFYRNVTSIFIPIYTHRRAALRRLIPLHVTAIRAPKVVRCQQRQTDDADADGGTGGGPVDGEGARRFCIPNINPTERRVIRLHLKAKTTTVSLSRPLLVFSSEISWTASSFQAPTDALANWSVGFCGFVTLLLLLVVGSSFVSLPPSFSFFLRSSSSV